MQKQNRSLNGCEDGRGGKENAKRIPARILGEEYKPFRLRVIGK